MAADVPSGTKGLFKLKRCCRCQRAIAPPLSHLVLPLLESAGASPVYLVDLAMSARP